MPIAATNGLYPSVEQVNNLVRVLVNDTFAGANKLVGEGRVYTDTWTPNITILNAAILQFQRDLEVRGVPTTREITQVISNQTFVLTQATAAAGSTTYTGTIPIGVGNGLLGAQVKITGFANSLNNGTFVCLSSTATTLILGNAVGVNETHPGVASLGVLTAVNGPLGLAVADPKVLPYLSFNGWWDGSVLNTVPTLPVDLLVPLKIRTRLTGTNNPFLEIHEFPSGLVSCNQTNKGIGGWQWITDRLYFNGSLVNVDIELQYTGGVFGLSPSLAPTAYATTFIPFLDSLDALAYKVAYIFCSPRVGKDQADSLDIEYQKAMVGVANRWLRIPMPPTPQG